ncbi:MAG: TrkA C-terminal domain-containing protein, partial [Bacteroidales bacterium]
IIEKVRKINKNVFIVVRSPLIQNIGQLYKIGADQVLPEKFEIAVDLLNIILFRWLVPQKEINRIITHIRNTNLGEFTEKDLINQPSILHDFSHIKISAIRVESDSPAEGKSPIDIDLRKRTGVTLLAIERNHEILEHPVPETVFKSDDIAYVLGDPEQVNYASELLLKKP